MIRVREDIEGFSPGWGCTRTQSWPRPGGWRWTWGTSSPRELLWNITFPDMSPLCFSSSKLKRPSRLSELRTALKSRRTWTIISFGSLPDVIWLPQWLETLGLAEVGSWGGADAAHEAMFWLQPRTQSDYFCWGALSELEWLQGAFFINAETFHIPLQLTHCNRLSV